MKFQCFTAAKLHKKSLLRPVNKKIFIFLEQIYALLPKRQRFLREITLFMKKRSKGQKETGPVTIDYNEIGCE